MKKQIPLILVMLVLAGLCTGLVNCGYKLAGFNTQIPDHVRSVYIPEFENKTTRYQIDQFVTFAVREEFIKRSRLNLADRQFNADAMIEGVITKFIVKPLSYNEQASANLYKLTIEVDVRFIDLKTNTVIFEGSGIDFVDTYELEEDESDFFSAETITLKDVAEKFAESIVVAILENF